MLGEDSLVSQKELREENLLTFFEKPTYVKHVPKTLCALINLILRQRYEGGLLLSPFLETEIEI